MEIITSKFTRFDLTEDEQIEGTILNPLQYASIQNLLCELAEAKLDLTMTRKDYDEYWQQEASFDGQIKILTSILTASDAAREELMRDPRKRSTAQTDEQQPRSGRDIFDDSVPIDNSNAVRSPNQIFSVPISS